MPVESYRERSREDYEEERLIRELGWSSEEVGRARIYAREIGYRSFLEYLEHCVSVKRILERWRQEQLAAWRRRAYARSRVRMPGGTPPMFILVQGETMKPIVIRVFKVPQMYDVIRIEKHMVVHADEEPHGLFGEQLIFILKDPELVEIKPYGRIPSYFVVEASRLRRQSR
jgi:hypothetical protein